MKKTAGRTNWLRRGIQIAVFALITLIAVNHTLAEQGMSIPGVPEASIHAVCPFGGVESLYQWVTMGTFTKKIHESSLVLGVIVLVSALLFGPAFCAWICPMGSLQEWIGRLGKRLFGKKYNAFLPAWLDKPLRYLRYVSLGLVLYFTANTGVLSFDPVDPYSALFHFWTGEVAISALVVLVVVMVLSLFVERPFCKYACPYGAFLGLTNLVRVFGIKRQAATCIDCKKCDKACPMNIKVSGAGTVRDHQCISCLECTSEQACPVDKTVELAGPGFIKNIRTLQTETTVSKEGV